MNTPNTTNHISIMRTIFAECRVFLRECRLEFRTLGERAFDAVRGVDRGRDVRKHRRCLRNSSQRVPPMLRVNRLPGSLAELLEEFRPCFTAPTFTTFAMLAAGLIARPAGRTVCGMLAGAGLGGVWHHSRAHRFFAAAAWSADAVGPGGAAAGDRLAAPGRRPGRDRGR